MINHSLAKELKDAGFKHDTLNSYVFHESYTDGSPLSEPVLVPSYDKSEDWDTYVPAPTLSELIAACRATDQVWTGLFLLSQGKDGGAACAFKGVTAEGSDPEEAVARLYLALNKNA